MARLGIGWQAAAFAVAALVLMPVLALAAFAGQGSPGLWSHLIRNVLPSAASQTVILLLGVGLIVASIGTVTAWLVAACEFPGRRIFGWALLLPLAVPTYIVADTHVISGAQQPALWGRVIDELLNRNED